MKTQGFLLVPGFLQEPDIKKLKSEFSRLTELTAKSCVRHALDLSEVISALASSPHLLNHLPEGFAPVRCILFDKTPENNWPVAWHQDLTIAVQKKHPAPGYHNWSSKAGVTHVQPPTELLERMITARIHLDDTPAENGALKVIPGTHLSGKLENDTIPAHTTGQPHTCACEAGDLLLMKPLILHASDRSTQPAHRRIIHIEYADRTLLHPNLEWHESP